MHNIMLCHQGVPVLLEQASPSQSASGSVHVKHMHTVGLAVIINTRCTAQHDALAWHGMTAPTTRSRFSRQTEDCHDSESLRAVTARWM